MGASVLRRVATALWAIYEYVAMLAGLLALGLMCLIWLPFAMLLYVLLPRHSGQMLGRYVIMLAFRLYLWFLRIFCACRFDLSELDALPKEQPQILVANHPSLLDAVLIVSRLPNAVCIMKAGLMNNVLLGSAARLARYIRNDAPLKMVLSARNELSENSSIVLFPEGTRTSDFPLGPCTNSATLISRRTGTPMQALLIEFNYPYLGKHWPLHRRPMLPLQVKVRLGKRFAVPNDVRAATREMETYFREELTKFT